MPQAVLSRATKVGAIELFVSDRTASNAGVARDSGWDRDFLSEAPREWRAKLRQMDEAETRRERRRRRRELPMTSLGIGEGVDGVTIEDIDPVAVEAMRGKAKPKPKKGEPPLYPNAGRFCLAAVRDRPARLRGTPGNAAPGGGRGGGGE
jgi:hypothetical protein